MSLNLEQNGYQIFERENQKFQIEEKEQFLPTIFLYYSDDLTFN